MSLIASVALASDASRDDEKAIAAGTWQEDLVVLAQQLPEKHADAFRWTPKVEYLKSVERLNGELRHASAGSSGVMFAELVASLKDGHSFVEGYFPLLGFRPHSYPIRLFAFADGVHVQAAAKPHARLLGARVVAINGRPIEEVLSIVARMFPAENDMAKKAWAVHGLTSPEVLRAYRLLGDREAAIFDFELDGKRQQINLAGTEGVQPEERAGQVIDARWVSSGRGRDALRFRHPERAYWSEFDAATKTYFVQFNEIRDQEDQGVIAFFRRVAVDAERLAVERFVLDMRWNPGGETGMNDEIVRTLLASPAINRPGRFFVLIGRRTFSSAQLLCTALDRYSHAVIVGEPTSNRTHFFANTRKRIVLPNSQLGVFVSTNWWQPTNSEDLRPWLVPDIAVDELYADMSKGHDAALAATRAALPGIDLAAAIVAARTSAGFDWKDFLDRYRAFKSDSRNRHVDTESQANDLAYALLESGRKAEALRFFEFNTTDYPGSANAFDSLAEAQAMTGNTEDAIANYRKVLVLSPDNIQAREAIERIEKARRPH